MATSIPAKLKTADVQRFATRAAQLEKFRPIVTYWCEYFILQIILNKQLHAGDDEVQAYAIHLMDKLEAYKSANAANDAVIDDLAAKVYIENFALETFSRADDQQRNGKVTRSTADTFQAAATFLDLLSIWGPLESEASAKSKFAKFHALRIARALKAGEDPNATNPKIEEPLKPEEGDDGMEAELRDLEREGQSQSLAPGYQQPTVESAPDSAMPSRPASTVQGGLGAPPTLPAQNINEPAPDVSPIDIVDAASRTSSVGGGYFPSVPTGTSDYQSTSPAPDLTTESVSNESHIPPAVPSSDPSDFYNTDPSAPPTFTDDPPPTALPPTAPTVTARAPISPQPPARSQYAPPPPPPVARSVYAPPPPILPSGPPPGGYRTDDEAVAMAQKHAKWAISALNFEDVPTAVKELQIALEALGAL